MIAIPMAGMSSRFFKAGFTQLKYMLKIEEKTLFDMSVESFSKYFESEKFIFIVKDVFRTPEFVENSVKNLE